MFGILTELLNELVCLKRMIVAERWFVFIKIEREAFSRLYIYILHFLLQLGDRNTFGEVHPTPLYLVIAGFSVLQDHSMKGAHCVHYAFLTRVLVRTYFKE